MKRSMFSEEQIIGILKGHHPGLSAAELCRKHGVSEPTFYKWRSKSEPLRVCQRLSFVSYAATASVSRAA